MMSYNSGVLDIKYKAYKRGSLKEIYIVYKQCKQVRL